MIPKEPKVIVTFYTTADAIAMEKKCKEEGIPGRLIPVPREISAGCGLSWSADPSQKEKILEAIERFGLHRQGITEVLI